MYPIFCPISNADFNHLYKNEFCKHNFIFEMSLVFHESVVLCQDRILRGPVTLRFMRPLKQNTQGSECLLLLILFRTCQSNKEEKNQRRERERGKLRSGEPNLPEDSSKEKERREASPKNVSLGLLHGAHFKMSRV